MNETYIKIRNRIIPLGIILLLASIPSLIKIWTSEDNLVEISGTLSSSNIYVNTINKKGDFDFSRKRENNIIEILFYLKQQPYNFRLYKGIGKDNWEDNNYNYINKRLRAANNITVFISEDDIANKQPDIYALKADDKELITYNDTKSDEQSKFLFLSLAGCVFIAVPFIYRFLSD